MFRNIYVLAQDTAHPVRVASCSELGEQITNIGCGHISDPMKLDIVVTTFSGTMFVLPWQDSAGFSMKNEIEEKPQEKSKLEGEASSLKYSIEKLKADIEAQKKK